MAGVWLGQGGDAAVAGVRYPPDRVALATCGECHAEVELAGSSPLRPASATCSAGTISSSKPYIDGPSRRIMLI